MRTTIQPSPLCEACPNLTVCSEQGECLGLLDELDEQGGELPPEFDGFEGALA